MMSSEDMARPGGEPTTPSETESHRAHRLPTQDWPALQQFWSSPADRARYLIQTYRREASSADDETAARLLIDIARLHEHVLDDPRSALEAVREAMARDPGSHAAQEAALCLLATASNPQETAKVLETASHATQSPERRNALLLDLGSFRELRLKDGESAASAYRELLDRDPGNVAAAESLLPLLLRGGHRTQASALCTELAEIDEDTASRFSLLLAGGLLTEKPVERVRLAKQALKVDRASDLALAVVLATLAQHQDWEGAVALLQEQARHLPERAAVFSYLTSRILALRLGQGQQAIQHAEEAHAAAPDDLLLVDWLAELLRRETRWRDLVDVLRKKAALVDNRDQQLEIHLAIAEILEKRLRDPDQAMAELEAALDVSATDLTILQALGTLYTEQQRWEELASMHLKEAQATDQPGRKAAALYNHARIVSDRLDRHETAIEQLERAVELDGQLTPALRLLEDLYRDEERYRDLADLYRTQIDRVTNDAHKVLLLQHLATLLEVQLQEDDEAIAAYEELLDLRPADLSAAHALTRLYERQRSYPALLAAMRGLVSNLDSPQQKAAMLVRMGQIYEEHTGEPGIALAHYQEALALTPEAAEVYGQIGRLLFAAGRWNDLIELHRRQLELMTSNEERTRQLVRIARLQERQLDDPDAAVATYNEVLALDPTNHIALRGVVRQAKDYSKIAQHESGLFGEDRATSLLSVGQMLEEEAGDADGARRFYAQAVAADPDHPLAQALLVRLLVQHDRWNELLDRLPPLTAGVVAGAGIGQLKGALTLVNMDLQQHPTSVAALRWAEALAAATGDRVTQAHALAQRAEHEDDMIRRAAARERAATLTTLESGPGADPVSLYREILDEMPGSDRALDALVRLAYVRQDHDLMLEVLERAGASGQSPKARATAYTTRASMLAQKGRMEEAVQDWRRALAEDPLCRSAYDALKAYYWDKEEEALSWVLETGLGSVTDPEAMTMDLLRRADLREQRNAQDKALDDLDRVLATKPDQTNALERVNRFLRSQGDYAALAPRLLAAAEHATDPARKSSLYLELALVQREHLHDLELADRFLAMATGIDNDNITALVTAAGVRLELEQPLEALALLNRVVLRAKDDEDLFEARLEIARISHDVLGDLLAARASLEAILSVDPYHLEALRRLAELIEPDDHEKARPVLMRLVELEPEAERKAEYLVRLSAALRARHGNAVPEVLRALEQAIELADPRSGWIEDLAAGYESAERWEDLERLVSRHIEHVNEQQRPHLLLQRGRVLATRLGRSEEAAAVLREALKLDPENVQIVDLLLEQIDIDTIEDTALINEAIDLHRSVLRRHPLLVDSLRALRKLCDKANRTDESYNAASCLLLLEQASEEETYFQRRRRRRSISRSVGPLPADQRDAIGLPAGDHPVRRVLARMSPHLPGVIPLDLDHYGLDSLTSGLPEGHLASAVSAQCAQLLGLDELALAEAFGGAARGVIEPGPPPTLILPPDFLRLPAPEQRFLLGRLMTRALVGTEVLDPGRAEPLGQRDLELLLASILRAREPDFGLDLAPPAILDDMVERLRTHLDADQLESVQAAAEEAWIERNSLDTWIRSTELGACRGGLLCCGNIVAAASFLSRSATGRAPDDVIQGLAAFATSSEYAALRRQMGITVLA